MYGKLLEHKTLFVSVYYFRVLVVLVFSFLVIKTSFWSELKVKYLQLHYY